MFRSNCDRGITSTVITPDPEVCFERDEVSHHLHSSAQRLSYCSALYGLSLRLAKGRQEASCNFKSPNLFRSNCDRGITSTVITPDPEVCFERDEVSHHLHSSAQRLSYCSALYGLSLRLAKGRQEASCNFKSPNLFRSNFDRGITSTVITPDPEVCFERDEVSHHLHSSAQRLSYCSALYGLSLRLAKGRQEASCNFKSPNLFRSNCDRGITSTVITPDPEVCFERDEVSHHLHSSAQRLSYCSALYGLSLRLAKGRQEASCNFKSPNLFRSNFDRGITSTVITPDPEVCFERDEVSHHLHSSAQRLSYCSVLYGLSLRLLKGRQEASCNFKSPNLFRSNFNRGFHKVGRFIQVHL